MAGIRKVQILKHRVLIANYPTAYEKGRVIPINILELGVSQMSLSHMDRYCDPLFLVAGTGLLLSVVRSFH